MRGNKLASICCLPYFHLKGKEFSMFKQIFESMQGVEIWPIIGLLIFFTVFVLIIAYVLLMDKSEVKHMANLPLDNISNKNGDKPNG